jgi:hypothetical protein
LARFLIARPYTLFFNRFQRKGSGWPHAGGGGDQCVESAGDCSENDSGNVSGAREKVAPGAYKAMAGLEHYLHESGREESLLHLIKSRAWQINGCA